MIKDKFYSEKWTPWIVLLLRLIVGSVFVFSGFVKAIDPWGLLYKLGDYTAALGLDWLSPFLLFGAFAISIVEFVLGVCLVMGAYRRFTVWLSFFIMLVMTALTGWLAYTGAVPDCGCFGDAIVMSNEATFVKNVLLLLAVIYLLRYNVRLFNVYSHDVQWMVTMSTSVYVILVACTGYFSQPMIDFRPFKVGTSLLKIDSSDVEDETSDYLFVYENNGELKEFTAENVPAEEDSAWTFVERKQLKKATAKKITDLTLTLDGEDVTQDVIKTDGEQLIFVYSQMNDIGISYTYLINILEDFARKNGADVIGVTDASAEDIANWVDVSMTTYPIYSCDGTVLKMLARGNPAVVYAKDGVIEWKRTLQSIDAARVEEALNGGGGFAWIASDYNGAMRLNVLTVGYIILLVMILILNRSYRVFKFSSRLIDKNKNKNVTLQNEK